MECNYFECGNDVCDSDMKDYTPPTLMFCDEHREQVDEMITEGNGLQLIAFWVKSMGGAKRAAQLSLEELHSYGGKNNA